LLSHRHLLPELVEPFLGPLFQRLEFDFGHMLDAFIECFRQDDFGRELPTVRGALAEVDDKLREIRDRGVLDSQTAEAPLRMLDLVGRYHGVADALEECSRLIRGLHMQEYRGDYAL
jgi:hypothetical protein